MTFERLIDILEAYGADSARWPADERAAAWAFVAKDARAADALAEARRLDELLDSYDPGADASAARVRNALEKAIPSVPSAAAIPFLAAWSSWQRAVALAAVLMFGVATGMVTSAVSPSAAGSETDIVRLAFDGGPFEAMGL